MANHQVTRTRRTQGLQFAPLSDQEESIAKIVVASAYAVHSALGPGLLENIYEVCFCHELTKRGLAFRRQVVVPIVYDGINFNVPLIKQGIKRIIL